MSPDELRALADALEPMARAPRFEDFDVPAFCAWVRACADEKPFAWAIRDGWSQTRFSVDPDTPIFGTRRADYVVDALYLHPAPAAPQAMEDANVWKQIVPDDAPQAEPKREPSAAEWLSTDDAETHLAAAMRDAARIAPPSDDKAILDALKRRGIWLAQIGGSDE